MKTDIFQVGIITAPHGVHGEVRVFPTTDDPLHYKKLKTVLIEPDKRRAERASGAGSAPGRSIPGGPKPETVRVDQKDYLVYHIRQVKYQKNMAILGFEEIHSMDEAEGYRNCPIYIRREQSVPCGEHENFIADLIDMDVVDEEEQPLGTLTDVLMTGANDVYVVTTSDGREILIPAIRQCILSVSVEENRMKVHLLPGLT